MSTLWWIGGGAATLGTLAHAVGGEWFLISRLRDEGLPDSPLADRNLVRLYLRAAWHLITVDLLLAAILLFAGAHFGPTPAWVAIARVEAIHFAGYVAVALVTILGMRRLDAFWRVPQLY